MRLLRNRMRRVVICVVACGGLCMAGRSTWADIKMVTEIQIEGYVPGADWIFVLNPLSSEGGDRADEVTTIGPHTITAYYKDKMARTETDTGKVTLYDGVTKKVIYINTEQKTYRVMPLDAAMKSQALPFMPPGARLEAGVDLDVSTETRAVTGKQTRRYSIDGYMRAMIDREDKYDANGPLKSRTGDAGGIGFPANHTGGGNDDQPPGAGKALIPSIQVGGDYWLADASILPFGGKNLMLPLVRSTFPLVHLLKPMNDKLAKLKKIPLYSQVTIRAPGSGPPGAASEVITAEVKSITEEALDDALFKVPDGYQKVEPAPVTRQSKKH